MPERSNDSSDTLLVFDLKNLVKASHDLIVEVVLEK